MGQIVSDVSNILEYQNDKKNRIKNDIQDIKKQKHGRK